ncbi:MAG: BON domain-containing protein [Proteobacteria bacterium]|nr:BON domain-containing protein [Pseudomonadota bacterium]
MNQRRAFNPSTLIATGWFLLAAASLGGCVGTVVGAGATTGIAVAQERAIGDAVDDTSIQFQINDRLLRKSEALFAKTNLDVVEGRVLITGVVQQEGDRAAAAELAWQVQGVREVLNELQIAQSGDVSSFVKDASITAQLRFKMLSDRDIYGINFSLTTVNAIVYLFGIARTEDEHQKLVNHARNVKGVKKVVSHVLLKDDPRRKA